MMVVTTPTVPGWRIVKVIGLVRGNTIRCRHLGKDVVAVLKNMVGGEIQEYTKMMAEAREQALDRMIQDAQSMGANAVVSARFTTNSIVGGAAELLAYGTGVVVERDEAAPGIEDPA
jgi:uncharacterized protein YbjQ (UPF0145 family)